ncbi:MAG: maleylpyruvate isomerase N-terminal domain-containing protein [Ilumatobacteraceae bacterium]|nr:maleylpyruvate isomerase N-terminal domain-containing protein [Ilumatobacteraceae bacterium]
MEVSEYIEFVTTEGDLFASAADNGELNVGIEACPSWDMRDLVRHLGLIHLWAAANVAIPQADVINDTEDLPDLARYWPTLAESWPDDADLVSWYRNTHANLVEVLEAAPADLECATFLPAKSPLSMWARRQASEIAVHRVDAEESRGIPSQFEPRFAGDMLDELLSAFVPRRPIGIESSKVLHVHAQDTNEHWYVTFGPERTRTSRHGERADLTLTGTAAGLYVQLWNRTPDSSIAMIGDSTLMDLWRGNVRVRWS